MFRFHMKFHTNVNISLLLCLISININRFIIHVMSCNARINIQILVFPFIPFKHINNKCTYVNVSLPPR